MAIIRAPDERWRNIEWQLERPAQVNRSAYTGARTAWGLPGGARWSCSAEHVPIIGEANIRAWRSFFAKLKGSVNTFLMPATEGVQAPRAFYHLGTIAEIDNGTNVTVSADGRDLTRSLAGNGWGQAYAYHGGTAAGGARLSFRAVATSVSFMGGLNSDVSGATGYTAIDYVIHCVGNGLLQIYESGVLIGTYGSYTTADILAVIYDDALDIVTYHRNGEVLRQVSVASGLTLRADFQFYDLGAGAVDVSFGELAGVAPGSTQVDLSGPAGSQDQAVAEGMHATALFEGGGSQLVVITDTVAANGFGNLTAPFEPPLRGEPYAFVVGEPFCQVALDDDVTGYSVGPGQQYGFGITASEAF